MPRTELAPLISPPELLGECASFGVAGGELEGLDGGGEGGVVVVEGGVGEGEVVLDVGAVREAGGDEFQVGQGARGMAEPGAASGHKQAPPRWHL